MRRGRVPAADSHKSLSRPAYPINSTYTWQPVIPFRQLIMHKRQVHSAVLSLLLLPGVPACLAGEEPAEELAVAASGTARPAWTRLVYRGDDLPGKPSTKLELTDSSIGALAIGGVRIPDNTIAPFTAHNVRLLSVAPQGQALHSGLRIWFDGDTGTVLQRDRVKSGPGGSRKTYRFGSRGATRVRLEPANKAQEQATPATWTQRKDKFYPYNLDAAGCDRVTVPTLLLYATSSMQPGNPASYLCVFQDDTLYRVWLEPRGSARVAVDYKTNSGTGQRHVEGERALEKIGLRIEPVNRKQGSTDFELLELRGEITIHIDPATGLPVQISGSRSLLGEVIIRLSEATLGR